ncbi:hypothetical protein [Kitasatospora purpeofusca]|uniref:hypothetical protein n=1 Tax=Kitasatospora purpeofusca TaxID=67352 RepID=UPI003651B713
MRKCDSCNAPTERAHSYILTTEIVVLSEAYWRDQFRFATDIVRQVGGAERALTVFSGLIGQVAGSATPWFICEDCSELFAFDRAAARQHALRGTVPEHSGPVDPGECVQFAAAAWEHVFGRWPANVQQPAVGDTCDLCAKKLYRGEIAAQIEVMAIERYLASGVLDSPPLCPPRESLGGWVSCKICMIRMVTRAERAGEGR